MSRFGQKTLADEPLKFTPKQLSAKRAREAYDLRLKGWTFDRIGKKIGTSDQGARLACGRHERLLVLTHNCRDELYRRYTLRALRSLVDGFLDQYDQGKGSSTHGALALRAAYLMGQMLGLSVVHPRPETAAQLASDGKAADAALLGANGDAAVPRAVRKLCRRLGKVVKSLKPLDHPSTRANNPGTSANDGQPDDA